MLLQGATLLDNLIPHYTETLKEILPIGRVTLEMGAHRNVLDEISEE